MDAFYFIIGFFGTLASIVALIIELMKSRRVGLAVLCVLVAFLSAFSGYAYFRYRQATDEKVALAEQRNQARAEAAELLRNLPSSSNYFSPGEGRGTAIAGLAFFEQHQRLYPKTYEALSETISKDIADAQRKDISWKLPETR